MARPELICSSLPVLRLGLLPMQVGEVASQHVAAVEELVAELLPLALGYLEGVEAGDGSNSDKDGAPRLAS